MSDHSAPRSPREPVAPRSPRERSETIGVAPPDRRPAASAWLDTINPVTKILIAVVLSVPLFASIDITSAAVVIALEVGCLGLTGLGIGTVLTRMAPVLVFAPVAGLSMLLYAEPSGRVYGAFWYATVSDGSIALAVAVLLRVVALGLPTVLLFAGTDPTDVADALAQVARLPSRFVIGVLAGTRTLGLFVDDWRTLTLARRARGVGDRGVIRRTAGTSFTLLVLAVRRGGVLATAMEARGFGSDTARTWARPSHLHPRDAVALACALAMIVVALACAVAAGTFRFVWS